ncbi:hypothetical protein SAMN05518865_1402 [Duganella sp. CF458]|uniref:hypothetical protein n=1 Tax=Duganella sp. CF458 TaxID=1884368 RepID=UPI0008F3407F|nr:hypothetical protein [Duganella sp. CF458]SFH03985.1 hypothetical protein SAMN05518865_1402 [Duganella sp. CF458]
MRYFSFYSESLSGEVGKFYCEVSSDNVITRQIDVFGSKIYWAHPLGQYSEDYPFSDQPEFDESNDDGEEITSDLFETIWAEGQKQ